MIYLIYGKDDFLKDQYIKKIKSSFGNLQEGINYIQKDSENINNIIDDIETPSFGYDSKLIIAKNTGLFSKKNEFSEKFNTYLTENKIENVLLIFNEIEIEKNSLYKTISTIGEVKEITELNTAQLINEIKNIANLYNVKIQEYTAQYLIECVGTNMQDIINELRKVIEYTGKGNEIEKETIDKLVIKKTESVIFELTDNLGKKDIKKAISILNDLRYNGQATQMILIMLYRHLKKLYITSLSNNQNITQNLNLKPNQMFLIKKYQNQIRYFKTDELRKILDELIKLDELSKNGNLDIDIGIEAILCNYFS